MLALSYSKNTARVRELKIKLVKTFGEYRRAAEMRQHEYKPSYHALQEAIHLKAVESSNKARVHSNVARLVNLTVGIGDGQRSLLDLETVAVVAVIQKVVANAFMAANDHHDGYQAAKKACAVLKDLISPKVQLG